MRNGRIITMRLGLYRDERSGNEKCVQINRNLSMPMTNDRNEYFSNGFFRCLFFSPAICDSDRGVRYTLPD